MSILTDCATLQESLGDNGQCIVDCRFALMDASAGRKAYLAGHIPGAVYADLDRDLAGPVTGASGRHPLPDPAAFTATVGRLGIDNDTRVVCYDDASGAVAARLWWLLRWIGHGNACILDGGIARWQSMELPLESGAVERPAREFSGSPRPELVLDTAQIVTHGAAALRLVDARDEQRFAGRSEPIDPVAGHIPGSANLPFSRSLNDNGTWRRSDEIREALSGALGGEYEAPWSVMCGSGVTACHLVAAGLLAGLPEPRVYVGSWSEWIRDPGRAVARAPGRGA